MHYFWEQRQWWTPPWCINQGEGYTHWNKGHTPTIPPWYISQVEGILILSNLVEWAIALHGMYKSTLLLVLILKQKNSYTMSGLHAMYNWALPWPWIDLLPSPNPLIELEEDLSDLKCAQLECMWLVVLESMMMVCKLAAVHALYA